jgi:predicted GNAT family N-acyltransferase
MPALTPELFEEIYEMFDASFPNEIKLSKKELRSNIFSGTFRMYILTLGKEVIGCFVYNPITSIQRCVFIEYLFIKKSYQNQKYGTAFLAECIHNLQNEYDTLFLDCQEHLIPYYEKRGFGRMYISKETTKRVLLHLMCYGTPQISFVRKWKEQVDI